MSKHIAWLTGVILFVAGAFAGPPQNTDFEQGAGDGNVPGWFVPPGCAGTGWSVAVGVAGDGMEPAQGKQCAVLKRTPSKEGQAGGGFGNLMQAFDAAPYRGKRIVITAKACLGKEATGRVQPWVRVDRAKGQMGLFDNCADRPVTEHAWKTVTIAGNVEDDAESICFGMMVLSGNGPAYLDDVTIAATEKPEVRADAPRALTDRGLANLEALTRALGYVRHYYPSDEAAAVDWNRFTVDAIVAAEGAENAAQLAEIMGRIFAPIAPAAKFQAAPFDGPFDPQSMLGAADKSLQTVAWKHRGFGPGGPKPGAIYVSMRITTAADADPEEGIPEIGAAVTRPCTPGAGEKLWMRVPIVLYKDDQGTLPHPTSSYSPPANAPDLAVEDRATRLAGLIIAWNVLQHHFPYFDVIKDDWNTALREALRSGATDPDAAAYLLTLQRLTAHLHDGHGYVGSKAPAPMYVLPLALTFVGDEVVVENAFESAVPKGVLPGDVVASIGGKPIAELVAFARAHEPAATEGFFHTRAARRLTQRDSVEPVDVALRSPEGKEKTASLKPMPADGVPRGRTGPIVSEPKPGIWYIDLDRTSDKDLAAAMPKLAKAKGVIFDMRGYPNNFSMGMLGHLSEQRLLCAKWEIPMANHPDREDVVWSHSRWDLPPLKPRITGKVAFITDGRAISAAETFMGIVEHYKLAEIVGEPTAGTNGNVNVITLPAGFSIAFTGMKVLKHDGSQHHGIGILPTVPAHRTIAGIAAGKDELLEKAIEVVDAKASGETK